MIYVTNHIFILNLFLFALNILFDYPAYWFLEDYYRNLGKKICGWILLNYSLRMLKWKQNQGKIHFQKCFNLTSLHFWFPETENIVSKSSRWSVPSWFLILVSLAFIQGKHCVLVVEHLPYVQKVQGSVPDISKWMNRMACDEKELSLSFLQSKQNWPW